MLFWNKTRKLVIDIICQFTSKLPYVTLRFRDNLKSVSFLHFVFVNFSCCSSERGLIIITVTVTSSVAVITAIGSTLNICTCFLLKRDVSLVALSDTMKENLLKSFLHSHFFKTSAQFSNESRKWTGELTSTQLSELTLRKFGIRSRKFMKKNSNFKFPCKLSIRLMKKLLRERFFRWILFICFRKNRHQLKIGPASGP